MNTKHKSVDTVHCKMGYAPVSDKYDAFEGDFKAFKNPLKKVYLDEIEAEDMKRDLMDNPFHYQSFASTRATAWDSGLGLDLSDRGVWDKYRPYIQTVHSLHKYADSLQLRTPWGCSTNEMRQFRYMGVDVILGYGDPDPNGYFVKTKHSVTIDGYWNGFWLDLDHYNAGDYVDMWIYYDVPNRPLWTRDRKPLSINYGNLVQDQMDIYAAHELIRAGGERFYRMWIRTRYYSEGDDALQNSNNGFLYAGYDKFSTPGREGHTFNNGVSCRYPMPMVKIDEKRWSRFEDGDVRNSLNVKVEFDARATLWRAPYEGPISQTHADMKMERTYYIGNRFDVTPILKVDTDDDQYLHYLPVITINENEAPNGSLLSKTVFNDCSNWINPEDWQGHGILTRYECYLYMNMGDPDSKYHISYGSSATPWSQRKMFTGWMYNPEDYQFSYVTKCNVLPHSKFSGTISDPVRYDNIVNPWAIYHMHGNPSDQEGDAMTGRWLLRSSKGAELGNEGGYDVDYLDVGIIDTDYKFWDIIKMLEAKYPSGTSLEKSTLLLKFLVYDTYMELGVKKESSYNSEGMVNTGYILEYPIRELRAINNRYSKTETVNNVECEITNTAKIEVLYKAGDNVTANRRYYVACKLFNTNTTESGHSERLILGTDYSGGYADLWKTWSSTNISGDINLTNLFKTSDHGREVRGRYVRLFASIITRGYHVYDLNYEGHGNQEEVIKGNAYRDKNAVFYINAYPDCKVTIHGNDYNENGDIVALINVNVTDVNMDTALFKIKKVWVRFSIGNKTYDQTITENANARTFSKSDIYLNLHEIAYKIDPSLASKPDDLIKMKITLHSTNNFDYGTTDDGTRVVNSNNKKEFTVTTEIQKAPTFTWSLDKTKGEDCIITVDCSNPNSGILAYSEVYGGSEQRIQLNRTYENDPRIEFNPIDKGYPESDRGLNMEFTAYCRPISGTGWEGWVYCDTMFKWNEKPKIELKSCKVTKPSGGRWTNNCGTAIDTNVKIADGGDRVQSHYYLNYNGKDTYLDSVHLDTSPKDNIQKSFTIDNLVTAVPDLYPIDLGQVIKIKMAAEDEFNITGNYIDTQSIKLINPVNNINHVFNEVEGYSTKKGDTIFGIRFRFSFDITYVDTSKFRGNWRICYFFYAKSVDAGKEFRIDLFSHEGVNIPNSMTREIDLTTNGNFVPGETYTFRLLRDLVRFENGNPVITETINDLIYSESTEYMGKVMYGEDPGTASILYPVNGATLNMTNPPIVIDIPYQSNPANSDISEVGLDIGNGVQWYKPGNLSNYNGETVVICHDQHFSGTGIKYIDVYIKSRLTGMTSKCESHINLVNDLYQVYEGDILRPMTKIYDKINDILKAYGLHLYTNGINSGELIEYNTAILSAEDAYNRFVDYINSVKGGKGGHIQVYKNELIMADILDSFNACFKEYFY